MEIIEETVYMRSYKPKTNRLTMNKFNKNLMQIIFTFMNIKEILKLSKVSKMFAKISLAFYLMDKYLKVIHYFFIIRMYSL